MQNIVSDKPYVPVRPHRGWLWPAVLSLYVPRLLRKKHRVVEVRHLHLERLKASLQAGHGIVLAPNHSRDEDPLVVGSMVRAVGRAFYTMASAHLFMSNSSKVMTFLLPRAGGFSIYREGVDRAAIHLAVEMLEEAKRPLVIFPEGFVSRTNDRLNVLLEGISLMARTAAKRRAHQQPAGKVVVHPVAIRYRFLGKVEEALGPLLGEMEHRFTWPPQRHRSLYERIGRLGEAMLALKEVQYLGAAQSGELAPRLQHLLDAILAPLETEWVGGPREDSVNSRVKRLRAAILPEMVAGAVDEAEHRRRWGQLADAYVAHQLSHYPPDYLAPDSTPERFVETVERFEEDLTDVTSPRGDFAATVTVGEAIEVAPGREGRGGEDPLLAAITGQLQSMLGISPSSAA